MQGDHPYWTKERLARLDDEIAAFETAAFDSSGLKNSDRKRRMLFAVNACSDDNVREILGRSVDDIARNPERVRRAIDLARGHVRFLRRE